MSYLEELKSNEEIFLNYMKEKYPFVSKSNFFLRDLQYGISYYFKNKNVSLKMTLAESIAKEFADYLVSHNKITQVSKNTWRLNYAFPKADEQIEEVVKEEN